MIIILSICAIACFSYGFSSTSKSNPTIQIDFKLAYEKQNTVYTDFRNGRLRTTYEHQKYTRHYLPGGYRLREYSTLEFFNSSKTIYIDPAGYPRYSDSHKLVHRCNMEAHLKRKLIKGEIVHHKDGDKRNFRIENLRLCANQDEHEKIHRNNYINTGYWYENRPKYINTVNYA